MTSHQSWQPERRSLSAYLQEIRRLAKSPGRPKNLRRLAERLRVHAKVLRAKDVGAKADALAQADDLSLNTAASSLVAELRRATSPEKRGTVLLASSPGKDWDRVEASILASHGQVVRASTISDAALASKDPDLVFAVVGPTFPDGDGRDLLDYLTRGGLPVLMVVADEGDVPQCLLLGAAEVFHARRELQELAASLPVRLGIEQRRDLELRGDPVTGLPRRSQFKRELFRVSEQHPTYVLAMFQLIFPLDTPTEGRAHSLRILADCLPPSACAYTADTLAAAFVMDPEAARAAVDAVVEKMHKLPLCVGAVVSSGEGPDITLNAASRMLMLSRGLDGETIFTALEPTFRQRVLLVDPDEEASMAMARCIRRLGLGVVTATNGYQALRRIEDESFDLVIASVHIPGGPDGMDVLRTLRAQRGYDRVPVVMLTRTERDAVRAKAYELGADDWLVQPIPEAVLKARVEALTQRRRVA
jgi:DNA-binding response OmpR family regulator